MTIFLAQWLPVNNYTGFHPDRMQNHDGKQEKPEENA